MWNIICDSGCDLFKLETGSENICYRTVPFYLTINNMDFPDDENLDIAEMVGIMKESRKASSSACPSPESWRHEMVENEKNICITVSKNLSGSYQSADLAVKAVMEDSPQTEAAVVDGCATGPASVLVVRKIVELIEKGVAFKDVINEASEYAKGINTVFALSCFDNLVKSGRISKVAGMIATSLGFWGVGAEEDGRIAFKAKVRGKKKAISTMLDIIKENGFVSKEVVISHCLNEPLAIKMKEEIENIDNSINVTIFNTRGLNSFYADEEGLIISY